MGLMSRMRMPNWGHMAPNMAHNMLNPAIDPSLTAYGQTEMGTLAASPQASTDAAAAAYGGGGGGDPMMMANMLTGMGNSLMQQAQPQFARPAPPSLPNPYRNRRQY